MHRRILWACVAVCVILCTALPASAKPYIEAWDFHQPAWINRRSKVKPHPPFANVVTRVRSLKVGKTGTADLPFDYEDIYNERGQLVERRILGAGGSRKLWWIIEYDDEGRRSKITEHTPEQPQFFEQASYDDDDRFERIVRRRATGNHGEMGEVTFEYARGRTLQFAIKGNMDDGHPMQPLVLKFDRLGRLEERTLMNSSFKPVEKFEYKFDKKTLRITEAALFGRDSRGRMEQLARHEYEWEEDEYGEWTKRKIKRFYASALERKLMHVTTQVTTREIQYAGDGEKDDTENKEDKTAATQPAESK